MTRKRLINARVGIADGTNVNKTKGDRVGWRIVDFSGRCMGQLIHSHSTNLSVKGVGCHMRATSKLQAAV